MSNTFATLVATDGATQPAASLAMADEADLRQALRASGEAAYRWDIATDQIFWSANAAEVLGCPPHAVTTGKAFANMLDADNVTTRFETVVHSSAKDDGHGVPYQIEYMFRSGGRRNTSIIWLEDIGHWQADASGKPTVAYGIVRRVDDRHKRDQRLNFLGNCDPLTGMTNRGRMTEALGEAIESAQKNNKSAAFAIVAVNNLAQVNEAYGFDVADEVIVAVARRLRQVVRQGDGIARYSGSRFGIILNECDENELQVALRRFISAVRDSVIETNHGPVWITVSIGAVMIPAQANDAQKATSIAEEALHEARRKPSDDFVIYQPSPTRAQERTLNARCAHEIVSCLKDERFNLAFQPIVNAKSSTPDLYEALLRIRDGGNGELISAALLVPVAENLGLIRLVDRSVLQLVLQTLNTHPHARLAMNVSGATATDPFWHDQILEAIVANPKAAERLTVEITETVALRDLRYTRKFVESLRKAGCDVAIDDFGAGYTSFLNLRELPVTKLKFDGSFSRDLTSNSDNEYMVKSLIGLAKKLELKTVAEWVERDEDAKALKDWGIDYLQGNLLGAATLESPWGKTPPPLFDLSQLAPAAATQDTVPAAFIQPAPVQPVRIETPKPELLKPEPAMVETIQAPALAAVAEPVVAAPIAPPAPVAPFAPMPEMNFDGLDDSIAKLRATLQQLKSDKSEEPSQNHSAA